MLCPGLNVFAGCVYMCGYFYQPITHKELIKEINTVAEMGRIAAQMEIRCKETAMPVLNRNGDEL